MKQAILNQARALGFDQCRFTTADPPATVAWFEQWLAAGYQAGMTWMQRTAARRAHLEPVLPGVRTVICLAASYGQPEPTVTPSAPTPATGIVARYARFPDYHEALSPRLEALTRWLNQTAGAGVRSRWYTDTGPILERDLAQRAGLGFIGKHTNLISRQYGNWILLAEILTTLELEPDKPETNHCGSCQRCLVACPTQAFSAPFQLDARRCISYLTIEHRGSIPEALRPLIGTRIFGCDDCLAVCPWNRFTRPGPIFASPAPAASTPDLAVLLTMNEAAFKTRFTGKPILRAKYQGLRRNVCVALGNLGARHLPELQAAAHDPDPIVAEHAAWALQQPPAVSSATS